MSESERLPPSAIPRWLALIVLMALLFHFAAGLAWLWSVVVSVATGGLGMMTDLRKQGRSRSEIG